MMYQRLETRRLRVEMRHAKTGWRPLSVTFAMKPQT
jgi:hypothetical protein